MDRIKIRNLYGKNILTLLFKGVIFLFLCDLCSFDIWIRYLDILQ